MSFTEIPSSQIAVGQPITQALMTAFRDNVRFAAESAWHPYDMVYPGDGTDGLLYDFAVDGAGRFIATTPLLEDGYEYGYIVENLTQDTGASPTLEIEYSINSGSGYGAFSSLAVGSPGTPFFGFIHAVKPRLESRYHRLSGSLSNGAESLSGGSFYQGTALKITNMRFDVRENALSGKIYLLRRREHFTL